MKFLVKTCCIPNCRDEVSCHGLCWRHYQYARKYKLDLEDRESVVDFIVHNHKDFKSDSCYIDNCLNVLFCKGLCVRHYAYARKHGVNLDNTEEVMEFIKKNHPKY